MIDLHLAVKNKLKRKKHILKARVKRNKSRRYSGALRKGYKSRAFTKIYLLKCY